MNTTQEIYGLDFTSAPKRAKPLTFARCVLGRQDLRVLQVERWSTFREFEQALISPGPWTMGIDFPFGQSRDLLESLGWPGVWSDYVTLVENMGKEAYERTLRGFGKRLSRRTDLYSRSRSPMQLDFTPVGKMFFQGAPRLLRSGATIVPCCPGDPQRVVLEAYPKLVVKALVGWASYKNDDRRKQTSEHWEIRGRIVQQLAVGATPYGIRVNWSDNVTRADAVSDPTGDVLDAVLCAVQAAWGWGRRSGGYGVPENCDRAEGWIVDPANAYPMTGRV